MAPQQQTVEPKRGVRTIGLFPGQGSQYPGMGWRLFSESPAARETMALAETALGLRFSRTMFDGTEEELRRTENASAAIFVDSLMAFRAFRDAGGEVDAVSGHSLGQYAALCAAGVFGFEEGVRLVRRRGELLARATEHAPGLTCAVLGLDVEGVQRAVERASSLGVVVMANYSSPRQRVISGEKAPVEEALRIALELGARKAVPLRVCGAFHSPLMASVVEELREALAAVEFRDPEVPVVDSVSGRIETSGEALRRSMAAQPTTPVRWISCSDHMREMGMRFGVELGPGRVLAGLMRYNFPELRVVGVESVEEARRASCLQQGVLDE